MTLILGQPLEGRWRAAVAWSAERGGPGLAVRRFRRVFTLDTAPASFLVHVSADSRYVLWVNGRRVGRGPLKGTLERYHYESYDLAPHLAAGKNVLAAEVFWFGLDAPNSELHSGYGGFLLQGPEAAGVDTPGSWKVAVDRAITPDRTSYISNSQNFLAYMEKVDGRLYPHGWTECGFDDSAWESAVLLTPADVAPNWGELAPIWNFVPRDIPALIEERRRFARTIRDRRPVEHLFGEHPKGWTLPAGQAGELVLDAGALTTGYPEWHFHGGAGRTVRLTYGEAIGRWVERPGGGRWFKKEVRDKLQSGVVDGYRDSVILPGGSFHYEPFHWRTFWFIRINVSPGDEPFMLKEAAYRFTTYPQTQRAAFESSDPDSVKMMERSWRTLQLCSHETYEDCPYHEQLQYIADSRIEALCSLALAGETRLPKRSILLFRNSLQPDGLIHCRVPSRRRHRLPYFALLWILMVDDYWRWVGPRERTFVRSNLFAVDGVLGWFRALLRDDGFVGAVPFWNPVGGAGTALDAALREGGSTFVSCLFACALDAAVRLHEQAGEPLDAERWRGLAERLRQAVREKAWCKEAGLFLEAPGAAPEQFSQHTQAQAILSGAATPEQQRRILERLTSDASLGQTLTVNTYYVARALEKAGGYAAFPGMLLAPWREQLAKNLSTWWETSSDGRSDCHAWTSWIALDFLSCVLGIQPRRPGFEALRIRPHTECGQWARGSMPTSKGDVRVAWRKEKASAESGAERVFLEASVPPGVPTVVELPGVEPRTFEGGGKIQLST